MTNERSFAVVDTNLELVADDTLLAWAAEALELGQTDRIAADADEAVEILEEIGAIRRPPQGTWLQ